MLRAKSFNSMRKPLYDKNVNQGPLPRAEGDGRRRGQSGMTGVIWATYHIFTMEHTPCLKQGRSALLDSHGRRNSYSYTYTTLVDSCKSCS